MKPLYYGGDWVAPDVSIYDKYGNRSKGTLPWSITAKYADKIPFGMAFGCLDGVGRDWK